MTTDKKKKDLGQSLIKNTGILGIGILCTKFLSFFLLPIFTSVLSTTEYGVVDLILSYSNIIVIVIGLQISAALFRFLVTSRENIDEQKHIISSTWVTTLIMIAIYGIFFAILYKFINIEGKIFIFVHAVASLLLQTSTSISRGFGKNAFYSISYFLSALISIVLNIILVVFCKMGLYGALIGYSVGPLVAFMFSFICNKEWKYIRIKYLSKNHLKQILKFSLPLVPNELSWAVIHASDRIVISKMISLSAAGVLAVASKFSALYTSLFSIFNLAWTEFVVLNFKKKDEKNISDLFEKVTVFFGCVTVLIISCIPIVYKYLVNADYNEGYMLIPIYLIAVYFNAIIGLISAIYIKMNDTKRIAISTIVAAIINLGVDLLLVNYIGLYAAPVSSLCAYLAISIWRYFDVRKRYSKIKFNFPKLALVLVLLCFSIVPFVHNNIVIKISVFIVVLIISIFLNTDIIKFIFGLLKDKLGKGRKNNEA